MYKKKININSGPYCNEGFNLKEKTSAEIQITLGSYIWQIVNHRPPCEIPEKVKFLTITREKLPNTG